MASHRQLSFSLVLLALAACGDDPSGSGGGDADDLGAADLGFNFDLPVSDDATGGTDTADAAVDCVDDDLEPSSRTEPVEIDGSTSFEDLAICRFQSDWFRLLVGAGERVHVTLSAPFEAGDLDLLLFDESLDVLDSSQTSGNTEIVVYGTSQAATLLLRVSGAGGAEGRYDLQVVYEAFEGCASDEGEPNESAVAAYALSPPVDLSTRICDDDEDWYGVDLPANETLLVRVDFQHTLGDLDLGAYDDDENLLEESRGQTESEGLTVGPFGEQRRIFLRVYGFRGALNNYVLALRLRDADGELVSVTGTVEYEDRLFDQSGFSGDIVARPARGVRVELVRSFDGAAIASGATDAAGDYALDGVVHPDDEYYVRALSTIEGQSFAARVVDRDDPESLYAVSSQTLEPFNQAAIANLLAASDEPIGGALNIVDVVFTAFEFVAQFTEQTAEELTVRWEAGQAFSCGSCYGSSTISLAGGLEDTDEYDDDIILHEFGHYFQDHFSDDSSPGGRHNGEKLDPRLAYGEGMATFLSSMIAGDRFYVDVRGDELRVRDLETALENEDDYYGTDGMALDGDVSEYLVAAIMWDSVDAVSADEPWDAIDLDEAIVMSVFMDYMRQPSRPNIGHRGIDLADWINGVTCDVPEQGAALDALLVEREYPWASSDAVCQKDLDDRPVRLVRDDLGWVLESADGVASSATLNLVWWDPLGDEASHVTQTCSFPCRLDVPPSIDALVVSGGAGAQTLATSWLGNAARERLHGHYRHGRSPLGLVREWVSRTPHGQPSTRLRPFLLAR